MVTNVARTRQITTYHVQTAMTQDKQEVDMNEQVKEIIKQVGTDVSGKWISVDNAEKFAQLVIEQYNKELKESRREIRSQLSYSRVGLRNI